MTAIDWDQQLMRTLLFVPGSDERKLAKVRHFGADVIVIDLEDAVADEHKTAARATTRAALPDLRARQVVTVRVNGIETGRLEDDIAAVVCPELDAVLVPKIEDTETLAEADSARLPRPSGSNGMRRRQRADPRDRRDAAWDRSLRRDPRSARRTRTVTAIFGLGDFSVALGVDLTAEGSGARLRARARRRRHPRRRDGATDRRPVPRRRGRGGARRGLPTASERSGSRAGSPCTRRRSSGIHRAFSELADDEAARTRRVVDAFEEAEARGWRRSGSTAASSTTRSTTWPAASSSAARGLPPSRTEARPNERRPAAP